MTSWHTQCLYYIIRWVTGEYSSPMLGDTEKSSLWWENHCFIDKIFQLSFSGWASVRSRDPALSDQRWRGHSPAQAGAEVGHVCWHVSMIMINVRDVSEVFSSEQYNNRTATWIYRMAGWLGGNKKKSHECLCIQRYFQWAFWAFLACRPCWRSLWTSTPWWEGWSACLSPTSISLCPSPSLSLASVRISH